jgi:hypothetical protein
VFCFSCFALACGGDKPGKNGVLPVNKMKLVGTFLVKDSNLSIPVASGKMYQKVFGLHHVSGQEFYSSFNFYRNHPEYFKILLDSLSAYGNRERDSAFYQKHQTPILDSVK